MAALADGGQELGGLVQQILETQKELEDVGKKQQRGPVEIVSFKDILTEDFPVAQIHVDSPILSRLEPTCKIRLGKSSHIMKPFKSPHAIH